MRSRAQGATRERYSAGSLLARRRVRVRVRFPFRFPFRSLRAAFYSIRSNAVGNSECSKFHSFLHFAFELDSERHSSSRACAYGARAARSPPPAARYCSQSKVSSIRRAADCKLTARCVNTLARLILRAGNLGLSAEFNLNCARQSGARRGSGRTCSRALTAASSSSSALLGGVPNSLTRRARPARAQVSSLGPSCQPRALNKQPAGQQTPMDVTLRAS